MAPKKKYYNEEGEEVPYPWTKKPLFEIKHLREVRLDNDFIFRYYKFFKKDLLAQNSISSVLHLIKFSQHPLARKNFYYSLCYLAILTKISQRWFRFWIAKNFSYSVLYTVHDITLFARGMEYHLAGTDLWDITPRMWYDEKLFNSTFLPYHKYVFKVTGSVFYTLWSYIEGVRRMKYNEYVRGHFYGAGRKRIRRVNYIKLGLWRGGTARLLKNRFFRYFNVQKYRIFRHRWFHAPRYSYQNDLNRYKLMIQDRRIDFHHHMEKLPWHTYWTPLITDLLIMKLSLYANHIVCHYTHYYTLYSRLDYSFVSIILWYFTFKNYYLSFFYRMVSDKILKQWAGEVANNEDNRNYTLIIDLNKSHSFIHQTQRYFLKTIATKLSISTFSEVKYLQVLLAKYRFDMNDHLSRPNYYFWWAPESNLALLPHFSGDYEEVDPMLGRHVIWTNYWLWRDFNQQSEEKILHEGYLEMPALFKHLTVEYHYYSDQISLWAMFLRVLRQKNILIWSKDLNTLFKKQKQFKNQINQREIFFPLDERRPIKETRATWKRPIIHPTVKILNQVYCEILKDFYMHLYSMSKPLDVFTHFLIKNDRQAFDFFSRHQEKLWRNLPRVFFCVRRFYFVYTNILYMYRRYPKLRCVMSKNDGAYRKVWDVYYQKMRRTGIKVDVDLPYYSKADDIDHIKDLTVKRRKVGFEQWHEKRWIIV